MVPNPEDKVSVVHVASINQNSDVHSFWRDSIALLNTDKTSTFILPKYTDFADVFSKDLAAELPEYTDIKDHAINLIKGQQPLYRLIYCLEPMELEILKTYIETNLANSFI